MWFENNGTASFTKNVIPFSNTCQSMHTLDFDGDGDTDMVIKRGDCCVVFVENDESALAKFPDLTQLGRNKI